MFGEFLISEKTFDVTENLIENLKTFVSTNNTCRREIHHPVLFFQMNDYSIGEDNLLLGAFHTNDLGVDRGLVTLTNFEVVKKDVGFGVHIHKTNVQQKFDSKEKTLSQSKFSEECFPILSSSPTSYRFSTSSGSLTTHETFT